MNRNRAQAKSKHALRPTRLCRLSALGLQLPAEVHGFEGDLYIFPLKETIRQGNHGLRDIMSPVLRVSGVNRSAKAERTSTD